MKQEDIKKAQELSQKMKAFGKKGIVPKPEKPKSLSDMVKGLGKSEPKLIEKKVYLGEPGKKGDKGDKGERGERGPKGFDGRNGIDGKPGKDGKNGENGTSANIDEVISKVIAKIPEQKESGDLVESIVKSLKRGGKNQLTPSDIKGMPLNMNDMRWHGGGMSSVSTDATLTGSGTPSSPLSVVAGGGSGTVTSVAALTLGTTGTDLSSTVANGTTTPVITLQVPTASATNRGALSSADWTTFNGALPKSGGTMTGKIVSSGSSEVGKVYTPATGSQTVALDCALNNIHHVTGHADGTAITFTVANVTNSQCFIVIIKQGAVASTISAWFNTVSWCGGSAPTLTAVANKTDTFGFIRSGADTYLGFVVGQNA